MLKKIEVDQVMLVHISAEAGYSFAYLVRNMIPNVNVRLLVSVPAMNKSSNTFTRFS